jgi:hypothetical protein
LTSVAASVAGGLICAYQVGYGIAAFGVGPLPFVGECAKLWVKISTRVEALFPHALINPVLRGLVNYFAIDATKRRSADRQRLSLSAWRANDQLIERISCEAKGDRP